MSETLYHFKYTYVNYRGDIDNSTITDTDPIGKVALSSLENEGFKIMSFEPLEIDEGDDECGWGK